MAEAEAGLELPIGVTEQKFAQQLARIEARAIKAANSMEKGFVKSNAAITRSAQGMSGSVRGQISNVSFQMQDLAVQIGAGTSAAQALGQQLPQLLGGFGVLGAVLGVVAAAGIPLAASLLGSKEESVDLGKAVKELTGGLEALREAQANAAIPVDLLIEKYGALGDEMGRVFQNQLAIARQELESMGNSIQSAIASTADIDGMVTRFDALKTAVDAGVITYDEYRAQLRDLETQFGLTTAQALQYQNLTDQLASANGPEQQAQAWLAVHDWIEANREALSAQGVAVDDLINQTNRLASSYGDSHAAAQDITGAADAGAIATDNWAAAAANLAAEMQNAAGAAGRAAAAVGAAIAAQNAAAGSQLGSLGGLDVFSPSTGRALTASAGGTSIAEQTAFDLAWQERVDAEQEAARKAASGGGRSARKKAGGGGGRAEKEPTDIFANAAQDLLNLERQITLIGKSSEETAKLKVQWELLDAVKKAGITVTDEMNAKIAAQADQVGRLTGELERGELAQQQFDQAVEGIANAFSNAILEGENLRDSLAGIFKQIAANILNAGIQNALTTAFSGVGGGGFLGSLLSSAFGGTKAAVPSFDGGGFTWSGSRSGGLDGKGGRLAMLHPNETVLDHTRGQGRAVSFSPNTTINVQGSMDDRTMTQLRRELDMRDARLARQVPSIMSDHQKRRG